MSNTKPAKVAIPKPEKDDDKKEIQVIERIIESKEIAPVDTFGKLTRPQVDLIKRTIAKGASDDELKIFIQVCKGAQLNPFLKQVFLVPRWDSRIGKEIRAIQVSIDGFRSIAESSGTYAGNDDPIFDGENEIAIKDEKIKTPIKASVTVYKMVGGQRCPFTATARWSEYYPGQKMGFQWHIRPYLMLGKCAEALALRKAFPKLLSGMYEEGELANSQAQSTLQVTASSEKIFDTLAKAIETGTREELERYKSKLETPGEKKYTEVQKDELIKMVNARLGSLMTAEPTIDDVK